MYCDTSSACPGQIYQTHPQMLEQTPGLFAPTFGQAPTYVQVIEFQRSTGLAHIHIAIDRYIEQAWAKKAWSAVGGGEHVHIQHVDVHRSAAYLSKYLSKDMLLNAPVGLRRVTTSRSIKLHEKKVSEFVWRVMKTVIDYFYARGEEAWVMPRLTFGG